MKKFFDEIIKLYSKYDMDISVVINDLVNSMTFRG